MQNIQEMAQVLEGWMLDTFLEAGTKMCYNMTCGILTVVKENRFLPVPGTNSTNSKSHIQYGEIT